MKIKIWLRLTPEERAHFTVPAENLMKLTDNRTEIPEREE